MEVGTIVRVAVDVAMDRPLDYSVPLHLQGAVRLGSHVLVPLASREVTGFVVGFPEDSFPNLRPVLGLVHPEPLLRPATVALAEWIARYYCCPLEMALRTVLPEPVRSGDRWKTLQVAVPISEPPPEAVWARICTRAPKQAEVFQWLRDNGSTAVTLLRRRFGGGAPSAVKGLVKAGLVELRDEVQSREPWEDQEVVSTKPLELNTEQAAAFAQVVERLDGGQEPGVVLIHGVTGSGKTEVYLQAIERILKEGQGAIMMVPEISLTPQTVERFRSRLGPLVAVLHSNLSQGERHDEWHRLRSGDARVVVGARSAVFAPVSPLGLIVVDEEHEGSYKQSDSPRYNARDLAVVRGAMEGALVLLGSATPSVESSYNARTGKYGLAELKSRVEGTTMPVIRVLDMRGGGGGQASPAVFSQALLNGLEQRLERGEQSILFLNRRGHSSSLCCPQCGTVLECPNCSLPLTYHRDGEFMLCHYCDHRQAPPRECPSPKCRSTAIRYAGVGTQRVELVLRKLLPKARIARLDSDSMIRKDRFIEILGDFRRGRLDILIGTQMIAKGLHFPNVTLVGIIQADMGLHRPDFRAGERTFQLLTQVAGRAGRGDEPGEVFVQSYTPFHPAIQYAYRSDYEGFYLEEIEVRRTLALPPWSHMVLLEALGEDEAMVLAETMDVTQQIRAWKDPVMQVSGPSPAPIARLRGEFRFQILIRTRGILRLVDRLKPLYQQLRKKRRIRWLVNVDPGQLM